MALPSESVLNFIKIRVVCKVAQPLRNFTCFFSTTPTQSWSSIPMLATNDFEYVAYVSVEKSDSQIYLFFLLETPKGEQIIDSNNGIFYQIPIYILSSEKSVEKTSTLSSKQSQQFDIPSPFSSSPSSSLSPFFPSGVASSDGSLANPKPLVENSNKNLPSISQSMPHSLIYVENPFRYSKITDKNSISHKIIKFQASPVYNLTNSKIRKNSSPSQKEISDYSVCSNCQGRYPKILHICPYCGYDFSK
ncbi:MAG: hypothetical protein ACTSWC_11190 [Promethearchaeota archaeon]